MAKSFPSHRGMTTIWSICPGLWPLYVVCRPFSAGLPKGPQAVTKYAANARTLETVQPDGDKIGEKVPHEVGGHGAGCSSTVPARGSSALARRLKIQPLPGRRWRWNRTPAQVAYDARPTLCLPGRCAVKLLWLSHFIPYPPRGGSRQRSFNLIRHISSKYETHLFALNMQGETKERAAEYAAELGKYCAEVKIWEPPYPWRGPKWWGQLMFSPFYRLHYGARALWSPALGQRWEAVLARHAGALVHFDSIDLALYFPPAANFRRALNHHNCESAMAERRAEKEPNPAKRIYLGQQAAKLQRLEQQVCHQFDVNLTVSELDAQTLKVRNPQAHCHVVENGTDTEYFHPSDAQTEPNTLVFAGGLSWYPNVSGIRFFVREIWPLLKQQRPAIKLYLAGRSPAAAIAELAQSDPAIELVPDPVDIRPWVWKASVFICPIIDGGGTRLKILDALAMGKAIVSTTIGAEGLDVKSGQHLLVADQPEEFAAQVVRLLDDAGLRKRLVAEGRAMVEVTYSWDAVGRHLEQAYQFALEQKRAG